MSAREPEQSTGGSTPPRGIGRLPELLRARVESAVSDYIDAAQEEGVAVRTHPDFLDALYRVWAASDFVAETCMRHPQVLDDLLSQGDLLSDYHVGEFHQRAQRRVEAVESQQQLETALRRFRRREMLRIVWRDLAGWAELDETLRDLTLLADACIDSALYALNQWLCAEYGTPISEDGREQGLVVLAMGKQGGFELNISSDIDLIFAYPRDGHTRKHNGLSNEEYFTRLGQRLIGVLNEQTAEGFVFRVDMRLRPYGDSGPLVASFDALEEYYQSQGREWERYAMIKARVVAGDRRAGMELLKLLRPFVYRRYLDFSVFDSLRAMKEMVMRQVERKGMENNIKMGAGGIREVEFIGQVFQLVRGGREPSLQARGIQTVLRRLVELGYLPEFVGTALLEAYRFLRRVENRLQAYGDEQCHTLPEDEIGRVRLAFAMGYDDWETLRHDLEHHRRVVHEHFEQVFAAPQAEDNSERDQAEAALAAAWQGTDGEHALEDAGFDQPLEALRLLHQFHEGHTCRSLGSRGRELLDRLMPMVLGAVGASANPGETLLRVVHLIEAVARRTAYLSLLVENPMALSQLVKLCAASPWIARHLAQHPLLLDELLDPRTLYQPLERDALRSELAEALADVEPDDLEQQMEVLRHFKQTNVLRVAAADVSKVMPLMVVSDHLTEIAETVLDQVLALAWRDLVQRHGTPGDAGTDRVQGFGIVAYGKLGGFELGYGSDLDLVFLHDHDEGAETRTDAPRPVEPSVFYARLAQRIIHVLNTLTPSGVLYEVDTRLRPSGTAGLLVSGLDAFAAYQREEAWTWEHQALVRARPVGGDPDIAARFQEIRDEALGRRRDVDALREEVRSMRERMRGELAKGGRGRFDLKQGRGGITDIEFLVQFAVLAWAWRFPDLGEYSDNIRQLEALTRHGIASERDARALGDAYRAYRQRIHELTLQEERTVVDAQELAEHRREVVRIWDSWMKPPDPH